MCAITSQAIGAKAEGLSLFVDGACSADQLVSQPHEATTYIGIVCGWASDLLEKVAGPVGVLEEVGCAAAPVLGTALGGALESKHEIEVAADIVGRSKCLKYSPTHFGSPWLAVRCAANDAGFAHLRVAPPVLCAANADFEPANGGFGIIVRDLRAVAIDCASAVMVMREAVEGHPPTGWTCRDGNPSTCRRGAQLVEYVLEGDAS